MTWLTKVLPINGPRRSGLVEERRGQDGSARAFPTGSDPGKLEELVPDTLTAHQRIELAAQCRDMDRVARRPRAGQVQVLSDQTRIQIMHNGLRVLADGYCGEWMTQLIARCHGCHEPQEERVFHEVMARLPSKATMIELGGYWAFYSLWFLSGGKNRRAVIVEPDPKHVAVGRIERSSQWVGTALCPRICRRHPVPTYAF